MAKPDFTQLRPLAANHPHFSPPPCGTFPDRRLTVTPAPGLGPNKSAIRLRGAWLARVGFLPRTRVRVRVMPGCLVITAE